MSLVAGLSGCDFAFRLDRVEPPVVVVNVARWGFDDGDGVLVTDSVAPGLDLVVDPQTSATWGTGSLIVTAPLTIRSPGAATKVIEACKAAGVLTLEAWVRPAAVNLVGTGPGRVFTISAGPLSEVNIMLGQGEAGEWVARLRTSAINGEVELKTQPLLATPPDLTHLVLVQDGTFRTLYVDGVAQVRDDFGGDLSGWSDLYALGIANEVAGEPRA